jgi:hypothetical protein
MALQIHSPSSSSLFKKPSHLLLLSPLTKPTKLKVIAQTSTNNPTPPEKKPSTVSPGQGFGSQSAAAATASKTASGSESKNKPKGNRRERASIIRRAPAEKPGFISQENEVKVKEQGRNETAFLLAWLGLGGIILVEGILLAASGMSEFMGFCFIFLFYFYGIWLYLDELKEATNVKIWLKSWRISRLD